MIGFPLYVCVVLLLIYPDPNQCMFREHHGIKQDLLKEKKAPSRKKNRNYVCSGGLGTEDRQKLCEYAMRDVVAHERWSSATGDQLFNSNSRNIRIGKFLDKPSTLPNPSLSGVNNSYVCYSQSVEGLNLSREMMWCKNRVFTVSWSSAWKNYDTSSSESDSDETDSDSSDSDESDSESDETDSNETNTKKTNWTNTNRMNNLGMANPMWGNSNRGNPMWGNSNKGNPMGGTSNKGNPVRGNSNKSTSMGTNASMSNPTKTNSNENIAEAAGFFITGSLLEPSTAYIFKPSPRNNGQVVPIQELTWVPLLLRAYERRHPFA